MTKLKKQLGWPHKPAATAHLSIHGYDKVNSWQDPLYYYGSDALKIRQQMNGTANEWLSEELKIHRMQVKWAVEHEMARTVDDVLSRRTRALLLNARESRRIAPAVASIMAKLMHKDAAWEQEQVDNYNAIAEQYILK